MKKQGDVVKTNLAAINTLKTQRWKINGLNSLVTKKWIINSTYQDLFIHSDVSAASCSRYQVLS